MIFVIDSNHEIAECVAKACGEKTQIFDNALTAMDALSNGLPELILMDPNLIGPSGWSFLGELISYDDTAEIPVVIMSNTNFAGQDLSIYGVVKTLNKDTMKPADIRRLVATFTGVKREESA